MFIFQDARYKTLDNITINQFDFQLTLHKRSQIITLICNQYTYVIYQNDGGKCSAALCQIFVYEDMVLVCGVA